MRAFDRVAALSVEGMNKSAIARITRLSWNTVARWLERAAAAAGRFNHTNTRGLGFMRAIGGRKRSRLRSGAGC